VRKVISTFIPLFGAGLTTGSQEVTRNNCHEEIISESQNKSQSAQSFQGILPDDAAASFGQLTCSLRRKQLPASNQRVLCKI
jgi:hypothetical protein